MGIRWDVLHVINSLSRGGASTALCALAVAQARQPGARIAVLSLTPAQSGTEAPLEGVTLIDRVRWGDVLDHVAESDIVHAHVWQAPEILEFIRRPLEARIVMWFHVAGRATPQRIPAAIMGQADALVLSASASARYFSTAAVSKPFDVIVPTRDVSDFFAIARTSRTKITCGHVGSLDPLRLPPGLLERYAALPLPQVEFAFAGGGSLLGHLRERARTLAIYDRTHLRGQLGDIRRFFMNCDVFCSPQGPLSYATSDMAIEEAMAAGLPTVLLSPEGTSDLVEHGATGLVAGAMDDYIDCLVALTRDEDLRLRLGRNARDHAAVTFRPEKTAASFQSIYDRLLTLAKITRNDLWASVASAAQLSEGVEALVFALGEDHPEFLASALATGGDAYPADQALAVLDQRLWSDSHGGIRHYQARYPRDPWLAFWSGLGYLRAGAPVRAMLNFRKASDAGLDRARVAPFEQEALARTRP